MLTPIEYLTANEDKPLGFMIDPRTKEGRRILSMKSRPVSQLKSQLAGLIDPDVFYNKYALYMAAASLSLMTERPLSVPSK